MEPSKKLFAKCRKNSSIFEIDNFLKNHNYMMISEVFLPYLGSCMLISVHKSNKLKGYYIQNNLIPFKQHSYLSKMSHILIEMKKRMKSMQKMKDHKTMTECNLHCKIHYQNPMSQMKHHMQFHFKM